MQLRCIVGIAPTHVWIIVFHKLRNVLYQFAKRENISDQFC